MTFGISAGAAMLGSAAIGAGASYLSAREQNKAASKGTTSTSSPWAGQQQYLVNGFARGNQGMYDAIRQGAYSGDRVADFNSNQMGAASKTLGAANNMRQQGVNVAALGQRNMYGMDAANKNASALYNKAGQNATGQIIQDGGRFANNPYLNGQIDAASRDVTRNLQESQLTGLDLASTGSGNMNSSRTGVAQGIMMRGAGDRIADISADMRSNAYQNGMQMSQNQYNTGMDNQMRANTQIMDGGKAGVEAIGIGQDMVNQGNQLQMGIGDKWQGQNQAEINGRMQAYEDQRGDQMNQSAKFLSAINGNYGGTTNTTGAPTSTIGATLGGLTGGLGFGMQLANTGMFRGGFSPSTPLAGGYSSYKAQPYAGQSYGNLP